MTRSLKSAACRGPLCVLVVQIAHVYLAVVRQAGKQKQDFSQSRWRVGGWTKSLGFGWFKPSDSLIKNLMLMQYLWWSAYAEHDDVGKSRTGETLKGSGASQLLQMGKYYWRLSLTADSCSLLLLDLDPQSMPVSIPFHSLSPIYGLLLAVSIFCLWDV